MNSANQRMQYLARVQIWGVILLLCSCKAKLDVAANHLAAKDATQVTEGQPNSPKEINVVLTDAGTPHLTLFPLEPGQQFEILRAEGASTEVAEASFVKVATTTDTSYTDAAIVPHHSYVYAVRIVSSEFTGPLSNKVVILTSNHQPTIEAEGKKSVYDSHTLRFSLQAADPDSDELGYSCIKNCSGVTISSEGVVAWKPKPSDIGTREMEIQAKDAFGGTVSKTFSVTVQNQFYTNMPAFMVVGQDDFTHNTANRGLGSTQPNGFNSPWRSYANASFLAVTDNGNNRVLIYNPIPRSVNAVPTAVLGQPNFYTSANQGCFANAVEGPGNLGFTGDYLIVSSVGAGRERAVGFPLNALNSNFPDGSFALGHADMTTCATDFTVSAHSINSGNALGVFATSNQIFLSDRSNNRVTVFQRPFTMGMDASIIIGQALPTTATAAAGPRGLSQPFGAWSDGTNYLVVADNANNRVLIYTPMPTSNYPAAAVVIGQQDFTSTQANAGLATPTCRTLNSPASVFFDGYRLFIADKLNYRILVYNGMPTTNNAAADIVLGQPNCSANSADQGGTVSAKGIKGTSSMFNDTFLIVNDHFNNRVLFFGSGFDD